MNNIKQKIKKGITLINRSLLSENRVKDEICIINKQGRNQFVFPSPSVPWGYMFQRPQQIAKALSKLGNSVIYSVEGEYTVKPDRLVRGCKGLETNLYLYNDFRNGEFLKYLESPVIYRYWATQLNFGNSSFSLNSGNNPSIYDWVDDIDVYNYSKEQIFNHKQLVKSSNLLITTAENIYEKAYKERKDAILLPNACDYDFFANPIPYFSKELVEFKKRYKAIIGYYGAIANWFDFELIKYCAQNNPEWLFLIVGETYPEVQSKTQNIGKDNVVFWKRVSYEKLPFLLSNFDVAIIPFLINDITQSTSPVKIYEYLAGGKPVVSTDLQEVKKIPKVFVAKNKAGFNEMLSEATRKSNDSEFLKNIKIYARENSWVNRANVIMQILESRGML